MNRSNRKELALQAISQSLKVRKRAKYRLAHPISIYDLCERLGIAVLLQDFPSMEGLYMPEAQPKPTIILSSLRPTGRKAITCGHELGHHEFKHGKQWDELKEDRSKARRFEPEEYLADMFSSYLQMPKGAVESAFRLRGLSPASCTPEQIFCLSTYFGVSYEAFVTHLERTLSLVSMKRASELMFFSPKNLRQSLLGESCPQGLVVADHHWVEHAIDVEVGDSILLPTNTIADGSCIERVYSSLENVAFTAIKPGIGRVVDSTGWCSFVRVMQKGFVGRAMFRFDEEVDDE
ncbi:MAG: ImmA/IrrE family metallo-endopeptidase [Pirellulaceae bacterium]|nr:ImmA/IrrE family metallo-endopeptidase [Pirellulaceae bacterium]